MPLLVGGMLVESEVEFSPEVANGFDAAAFTPGKGEKRGLSALLLLLPLRLGDGQMEHHEEED